MSSPPKRYGIAICGLGRAGAIHLGNCYRNPQVVVKYLVEVDLEKAEQARLSYGLDDTKVVHADQIHTALDDPNVHGMIIATVTWTHQDIVLKCIAAKKSVFCEKPIASDLKDIIACYGAAKEANVPIFCAFNRRFDKTHSNVREGATDLGKLQMVRCISRDSPLPTTEYLKISGGIFHDCIVHDIDMITWILNETPVSVFAHAHAWRQSIADMNDVDVVSVSMKFPSGCLAQIDVSRLATYGYDQRVEVVGEKGMLQSDNQHKTSVVKSDEHGVANDLVKFSFPQRFAEAYANELEHFLEVIEGKPSSVSGEQVAMVSLVASACEESFRSNKPVLIDIKNLTFSIQ